MKLEDQLKNALRLKHFSLRTEESYVGWYRRFVLWHGKRHPAEMGAAEVEAFLTHLAVNRGLAGIYRSGNIVPIFDRWFAPFKPSDVLIAIYGLNSMEE